MKINESSIICSGDKKINTVERLYKRNSANLIFTKLWTEVTNTCGKDKNTYVLVDELILIYFNNMRARTTS